MEGAEKENEEAAKQKKQQRKLKSCRGCLYYSYLVDSKSRRDPRCFGLTKTLQGVPERVVQAFETTASKEVDKVKDFEYTCVGYSVYLAAKDPPVDQQGNKVELPLCSGIRLLVGKKVADVDEDPVPVKSGEDGQKLPKHVEVQPKPPPRPYRPPQSTEIGFLSRFTRNASVVASGVSRNMHRVGRYIKDNVDDMLYPYKRRPK